MNRSGKKEKISLHFVRQNGIGKGFFGKRTGKTQKMVDSLRPYPL